MLIIGINGVIGSGKSTLANALLNRLPNSQVEAFALPLKRFCIYMLGLRYEQCYGSEKNSLTQYKGRDIVQSDTYFGRVSHLYDQYMTARQVMEYYAVYFRNIKEDFFVDKLVNRISWYRPANVIILVEDLRHKNELKVFDYTIRCLGKTESKHSGEVELNDSDPFSFYVDKTKQSPTEAADLVVADLMSKFDSKYFN